MKSDRFAAAGRQGFAYRSDMEPRFVHALDLWLPAVLREKALRSDEDHLELLGPADLARMVADFVIMRLAEEPGCSETACGLDEIGDDTVMEATGFSPDSWAAALSAAVLELAPWTGEEGVRFLIQHSVPADDALEFTEGVAATCERLATRSQSLVGQLRAPVSPASVG